ASLSGSFDTYFGADTLFQLARRGRPATLDRLYLDSGTVDDNLGEARFMRDIVLAHGFTEGASDFLYLEALGDQHGDYWFGRRMPLVLRFLAGSAAASAPTGRVAASAVH